MKSASLLLCLSVAFPMASPLAAQDEPNIGPVQVLVKLQQQGAGQSRRIKIGPRAAGVCRKAIDCSNHFTVRWVGAKEDGERIQITFVTPGAADCFDNIDFTVDDTGPAAQKTVTLVDSDACPNKAFFFYEVSCIGGAGGNCGGVEKVDPGAMVDGGQGG